MKVKLKDIAKMPEEKIEVRVIADSTFDKQPGVYQKYFSKDCWIRETIKRMAKDGWTLDNRLQGECMIFKKNQALTELSNLEIDLNGLIDKVKLRQVIASWNCYKGTLENTISTSNIWKGER